jgi:hypothetical protein
MFVAMMLPLLLLGACAKKVIEISKLEGDYNGTFSYQQNSDSNNKIENIPVKISFTGNEYKSSANANYMPAGGQGKYELSGTKVVFTDEMMRTANFDWNLLLNGTYTISSKSDSLFLVKKTDDASYTYTIKK